MKGVTVHRIVENNKNFKAIIFSIENVETVLFSYNNILIATIKSFCMSIKNNNVDIHIQNLMGFSKNRVSVSQSQCANFAYLCIKYKLHSLSGLFLPV